MDEHKKQEWQREQADQTPQKTNLTVSTQTTPATNTQQPAEQAVETPQQIRKGIKKYIRAKRWYKASDEYLKLLDCNPYDLDALIGLAFVLDMSERYDSLCHVTRRLLEIEPNSAIGLAYKARAYQKLSRLSEATIANDQALLLETRLGLAWINRSGLQLLQQKYPEALRSAQRATELAPKDARAWANLGIALFHFNRLGEAIEAFDQSLELDEDQIVALQIKAEIYCRIGRMSEVVPLVKRVIRLNPLDITAITQGIQAYRALEKYEELRHLAQVLIRYAPENAFAWEHYMRSLRGLGKFAEASEALDHLLALDSSNVRFWTIKADTLYRLERYREAVTTAERARHINSDYAPANRIYEKSLRLMYQRKERNKNNQAQ